MADEEVQQTTTPAPKYLLVHAWNSQCGECKYGGGSWASSPARDGKPILTPDSRQCPNCGVEFTHKKILPNYMESTVVEIESTGTDT